MAKPKSNLNVLTANRLTDGTVVFWTKDKTWSEWINHADVAKDSEWNAYLEKVGEVAEARNIIVEPYLVAVAQSGNEIEPLHIREKFRTRGPSVRRDLGKQARVPTKPEPQIAAEALAQLPINEPALIAAE